MSERDDWTMSLLADQGAYRGEYPEAQWLPSRSYPPARLPDAGQAQMGAIANTMRPVVKPLLDWFQTPGRLMQQNPYPQGSDLAQQYENIEADRAANWGAQNAMGEVFWPRWGQRGTVTSGAGSRIVQPQPRAKMGDVAEANTRARIGGNEPPPEFAMTAEDLAPLPPGSFTTGPAPATPPTARVTVGSHAADVGAASAPGAIADTAALPRTWAQELPRAQPAKRSIEIPDIRGMPVDEAIAIARLQPHLIKAGDQSEGYYVGGPREIQSKRQLNAQRKFFDEYIAADPRGGDWYDRYRRGLDLSTGGVPLQNEWSAAQHGQWSAGVDPGSELHYVLKEANAAIAGMPVKAARPAQHEAHMRALATGDPTQYQLGEKTGEYADQISRGLAGGQALIPGATGVNDFRHLRNLGYTEPGGAPQSGAIGPAGHKFVDMETALAVDRANRSNLGGRSNWTGEQLQAAPWVRQKALDIMSRNPALTYDQAFARANRTIVDYYPEKTYAATHEAQPGYDVTGHMPDAASASAAERQAYFDDPRSTWATAPLARDAIYGGLGTPGTGNFMRVLPSVPMQGMYRRPSGVMETNPGEVAQPMGSFTTGAKGEPFKRASDADKALLSGGEAFRAYVDAQNAGAWHKLQFKGPANESNTLFYPKGGKAPLGELFAVEAAGTPHGLPDVADTGTGITSTRFWPPPEGGKVFDKALRSGALNIPGLPDPRRARLDGDMISYVDEWKQGEGSGAATQKMLEHITRTPEMKAAFNSNPYIAERALAKFERDKDWAAKWGAPRQDIQNAREVIARNPGKWIDVLQAALADKSISLPAVSALLAGTAALHRQEGERRGGM